MFIDRLLNMGNAPLIERAMSFTAARHELLAENIANVSTPGYVQKDLSAEAFQKQLRQRLALKKSSPPGSVGFSDLAFDPADKRSGLLFHDRSNRSMEQMMADLSSNALKHNMYAEMLRKQFDSLQNVLKERIA
jgi:flagellar basal-body rod protein FlgB